MLPLVYAGVFYGIASFAQSPVDGFWSSDSSGSWGSRNFWAYSDPLRPAVANAVLNPRAVGTAVRVGDKITAIDVTFGGSGYTVPPTVIISDPGANGIPARGVALLGSGATEGMVTGVVITNPGSGYDGTPAAATVTFSAELESISMTEVGSGYNAVPSVSFTGGGAFTSPPTVTFRGGVGAGAVATATVAAGKVTAIVLDSLTLSQVAIGTATDVDFGYFRGDTTTNNNIISGVRTAQNLQVGTAISAATGIPPSTTISAVNGPASTLTLSANATASGAVSLSTLTGDLTNSSGTVTNLSNTQGLAVGMVLTGSGIAPGTRITAINSGASTLTLSSPATVTAAAVPMSIYVGTLSSGSNVVQNVTSLGAFTASMDVSGATLGPSAFITRVSNGGRGYSSTNLPKVLIVSTTGGSAATAVAVVNASGVITGFTVTNQGSGYSNTIPPSVVIASPSPPAKDSGGVDTNAVATGNAVVSDGRIYDVEITNTGSGYTTPPEVIFSGGGALGNGNVIATAEINAGSVTGVTVTNGGGVLNGAGTASLGTSGEIPVIAATSRGMGYTSPPTVVIGAPLIVQALISIGRNGNSVNTNPAAVTYVNRGSGYLTPPVVTFANTGWQGYFAAPKVKFTSSGVTGALATAARNTTTGAITSVSIQDGGSGYTTAPAVAFFPRATATATITGGVVNGVINGVVTGITVTATGSGYPSAPAVSLIGGGGAGASAVAVITGGKVTSINIVSGGSGYSSAPTVVIAATPVADPSIVATATVSAGKVTGVVVNNGSSGFTSLPVVAFRFGGVTHAVATPFVPNGQLSNLVLDYGGSGYASAPAIAFEGNISNGGQHAIATASISGGAVTGLNVSSSGGAIRAVATSAIAADGTVASVTVTNAGTGYTIDPIVTLGAPTGVATAVQPVPGGVGSFLHFNRDITGNFGINLDAARTVGSLTIGDTGAEDYTLAANTGGINSTLTFDMGMLGAGKSFLNKTQGDQDVISARVVLNDELNTRINVGRLTLSGGITGTGTLVNSGNSVLTIRGASAEASIDLWLWHRGTGNTGAQVELGATGSNSFGNIRLGNGSYGTAGFAVLQLLENRVLSLAVPALYQGDQIRDDATITVDAATNRWGYFKLMGGSETIGNIIDTGNALVLENMEGETINSNASLIMGGNNLDSYIGGFIRNRAGGSGTGTLGLTKNGTGSLTLQGGNISYTGPTLLNGGTLNLVNTPAFNSEITAAAGTRLVVDTLGATVNFDNAVLGNAVLRKQGTGGLNFNSGQTNMNDILITAGSFLLRSGAATLRGGKNQISGALTVLGDPGLSKGARIESSLSVGSVSAQGVFGQAGGSFDVAGQQLNLNNVGYISDGVLESSGDINISNMGTRLIGNVGTTDRSVQNAAANVSNLVLTDVSNLVIGAVLTLKQGESTAGVTIKPDTKIVAVNQDSRTVILSQPITIPASRGITFTYTSVTDGAVRGEYLNFTDVVHDGQKFIAITEKGTVHTSLNGTLWDLRYTDPAGIPFLSLTWTGERAVIVGSQGRILTSSDGLSWAQQDMGTALDLSGITTTNVALTGDLVVGSTTVANVTGASNFLAGTPVFGFATPPTARVASINVGGNSLTMDSPALDTATNVDFGYFRGDTTTGNNTVTSVKTAQNLQAGTAISAVSGIVNAFPDNTTITAVNGPGSTLTLSANATVAGTIALRTLTGNLTLNSSTVANLSNTQGLAVGMVLTGRGIPAGTRITSINTGAATLTLSDTATATSTAVPMSIYTGTLTAGSPLVQNVTSLGAFTADMATRGVSVPLGTFVVSSTANTLTLSQAATAAATSGDLKASKTRRNSVGTFTSGNAVVTSVSNVSGLSVGMQVALPGIVPVGTVITAINAPDVTLSASALASAAGQAFNAGFDIVVVGRSGYISTSAGGATSTWLARSSPTSRNLNSVTWSDSLLVAVGALGRVITSPDGASWSSLSPPLTNTNNVITGVNAGAKTVTLNNNALVTATQASFGSFKGDITSGSAVITNVTSMQALRPGLPLSSTLGIFAGATIRSVNEAGFSFVMSTPATATSAGAPIRTFTGLAVLGSTIITEVRDFKGLAVGMALHGSALTGTTEITSLDPANNRIFLSSAATTGGQGTFGVFYGDLTIGSATVSNVTNFPSLKNLQGIAHLVGGKAINAVPGYLGSGLTISSYTSATNTLTLSGPALASSTGVPLLTFTGKVTDGSNVITEISDFSGLAVNMNLFVTGTTSGPSTYFSFNIDAMDVVGRTLTLSAVPNVNIETNGITVPLGIFLGTTTASSTLVTSLTNRSGQLAPSIALPELQDVVWTGSQFVAVGGYGTVLTSPTGSVWTPKNSGTGRDLQTVALSDAVILAAGENGIILKSTDGSTWSAVRAPDSPALNDIRSLEQIQAVITSNGKSIALGNGGLATSNVDTWSTSLNDTFSGSRLTFAIGGRIQGSGSLQITNTVTTSATTNPQNGIVENRNNPNRIDDAATLLSRGGEFSFANNAANANFSETIGKLLLSQGQFQISTFRAGTTGTGTLTFGSLEQRAGATVDFLARENVTGVVNLPGTLGVDTRNQVLFTQAPVLDDGIIGGWATIDGEWAKYGANGVRALDPSADYDSGDQTGWAPTDNVRMTVGRTLNARRAVNSMNILGQTLTMGGFQLSVETGGILATTAIISSGELTVGTAINAPKTLNVIGSSTVTINASINDYVSTQVISATGQGAIVLTLPSVVGLLPGMAVSAENGAQVSIPGIPAGTRIESVTGTSITLTAPTTAPLPAGAILRFTGGSVGLSKSGVGLLALTASNKYTGKTYVNNGTLRVNATSALGAAPTSFVQDQIQINGGILQIGHLVLGASTPLPTHVVSFVDGLRGLTIGLAGGRIEVGQVNPDNNNATFANAVPIVNLTITNPINALGVLELAVRSNTGVQQVNTLTLGTALSTNNYAAGIRTEALFEGTTTIRGNNTIGGLSQEGGNIFIEGNNNFTAPIRSLLGNITITGTNTWLGSSVFEQPVEMRGGTLTLMTQAALGTGGINLILGTSGKLNLAGLSQTIRQIGSAALSVITNNGAPNNLAAPTDLIFNLTTSQTYNGTIMDGVTANSSKAAIKLIKSGPGVLTLNNPENNFSGGIEILEGVLNVTSLSLARKASPLGIVQNYDPAKLVIDKAVLSFTPTDLQTMDRSFTMGAGPNGATLVANGLTQTDRVIIGREFRDVIGASSKISDPIAFKNNGSRTLTLTGLGRGDNVLLLELRDKSITEISGIMKAGQGTWVLDKAAPYSGLTTLNDGILAVTRNDALGTAGSSTTVNAANDTLTGNLPNGISLTLPLFYDTTLPTGLVADKAYYVVNSNGTTFQVALTPGGAALPIESDGLNVKIVPKIDSFRSTIFNEITDTFTGILPNGSQVSFNTQLVAGVTNPQPPSGLLTNTAYYVINSTGTTFQVALTSNGSPLDFGVGTPGSLFYTTTASGNKSGGVNLASGTLELRSVNYLTPETITFEGGALAVPADSQSIWSGNFEVNASSTIRVGQGGRLVMNGNLLGTGFLTQEGEGTMVMRGEMLTPTTNNLLNSTREYALRAGTLVLDYSLNNGSKLSDNANLRLGGSRRGGEIILSGGAHEEIVGQTVLEAGANKIYRESGAGTISLNNIIRSTGSSLYTDLGRIAKTDMLNSNGILGAWAIIRDAVTNAFWVIPGTNSSNFQVTVNLEKDMVSGDPAALGLATGTLVRFSTTGVMPGGLSENTNYYIKTFLKDQSSPPVIIGFTLALTPSVLADTVDISSTGTGVLSMTAQTSFTVNTISDTFSTPGDHRLAEGSVVHISSFGTLPTGLSAGTDYYVIDRASRTFRLSTAIDGPAIDITSIGTGVHIVETQGAEKRVGSAALVFSINGISYPGSDGNNRIKVAIRPQLAAGAITSEITGTGTVPDPYIYTIKTTTDNSSNTAILDFVLSDPNNPAIGSSKLILAESTGDSTEANAVADNGTYGAPTFLSNGSNDNGSGELDWARNEGTADGFIMPNGSYLNVWGGAGLNHTAVTSNITVSNRETYSVRFATQNPSTVTLSSGVNGIRSGGILISPTVGANDSSIIGNGQLTMGGQGNLQNFLVHQYNELGSLIIGARITNRAVVTRTGRLSSSAGNMVTGLSATSDLLVGMTVTGSGINVGTTIASIDPDGHTIFLSQNHSVNATRPTLSFTNGGPVIIRPGTLANGDRRRIFGVTVPGSGANAGLGTVSTSDLYVGMPIVGPGIPVGSTITFIFDDNDIQVSTNHFFTGESSTMTLTPSTGVEKLGPGMLALGGANDFTGSTYIGEGVLRAQTLTDGGVVGSLGASNAASANLFFNGGTLQYVGENSRTNRGFQLSEFASINIGHERTSSVFTGAVAGTDRLQKDGPGTLIFNGNAGLESIRVEQGRLLLQTIDTNFTPAGFAATNFSTTNLTSLRVAGGTFELRGTSEGNVVQNFGSQFVVEEGASEIIATSVAATDPNNLVAIPAYRITSLNLMGQEEQTDVLRMAGGTARFIENPELNAGPANIFLFTPVRGKILPWATYRNLADLTQGGVNDFALVSATSAGIVSADFLYANGDSIGDLTGWGNTRLDGAGLNVSEGAEDIHGNIITFNGTISSSLFVNTLRYESNLDSVITIGSGQTLELVSGAILAAFDVHGGNKQILGSGNITGSAANAVNGDFIMHNYNQAATFTIGVNVVDRSVLTASADGSLGKGTLKSGEFVMQVGSGTPLDFFDSIRTGMSITGPGLADGTTLVAVDRDNRQLKLSLAALSTQTDQIYTLKEVVNFVQTGTGTTLLSGSNTYSGNTYVHGGVLRLNSPNALPGGIGNTGGTSALIVEGGVIGLGLGDFTRSLGSSPTQVQFKGNGGFAAYGDDRKVNLGGDAVPELLRYGNLGFVPDGSSLILGSHDATHKLIFQNPIDLSAFSQAVRVEDGPAAIEGELTGGLSGLGRMIKFGLGTLRLNATSTNTGGVEIAEGRLIAANVSNVFGSTAPSSAPVRLGTSYTNTNSRAAINLEVEGGTVAKKLEIGPVNASSSAWIGTSLVDSTNASADVGRHVSMLVVEGYPAMAYYDVSNQDLKYVRALDARGTNWGIPVTVASRNNVGKYPSLCLINGNPAISYYDETNGGLMYVRANDAPGVFWGTPVPVVAQADGVLCVTVQPDGKVLVGGSFTQIDGQLKNRVIRLNTNGSLDASFEAFIMNGEVRDILVQSDGKIVVGGTFTTVRLNAAAVNSLTRNRMARLNADGSLDSSYDPNLNGDVRTLLAQPGDGIMVGGSFTAVGSAARTRMARLIASGSLDATFASPDIRNGEVRAIVQEPAGTYVIGGNFTSVRGDGNRNRLARISNDGRSIDAFNPDANGDVNDIALLPDNKLIVGGGFGAFVGGVISRTRLARLNPNGTVDLTFAQEVNGTVNRLQAESSGDVLVAGLFTQLGDYTRNFLGRIKADGTVMVKDLVPGSSGSTPTSMAGVGGTLFFAASASGLGSELWKSDGTAGGTLLVKDIITGSSGSTPSNLTNVGGTLFFTSSDGVNGVELWKSDGTALGTVLVKDIVAGASSSSPANLTAVGSTLFFTVDNGVNGSELWKSDGTALGTVLVKDIIPGAVGSAPSSLTVMGGTLFFAADDGINGRELWKSDGTSDGTILAVDVVAGAVGSSPASLAAVGGMLFFAADDTVNGSELWKSDGTPGGTVLVKDISIGATGSSPTSLVAVGGILFFAADDGIRGGELWRSDGSDSGTYLVKDIIAGATGSAPASLSVVGSTLFFSATNTANGTELWRSDGTPETTVLLRDLATGTVGALPASSSPTSLTVVGGTLFFAANDFINGNELWKTDGTAYGTIDPLFDPNPDQEVRDIFLMSDGHIVMGGLLTRVTGLTQQVVARISNSGVGDVGFGRKIINVGQYTSLLFVNGAPAIAYHDVINGDLEYVRANDVNGASWGASQLLDASLGDVGIGISMIIANIGGDILTKDDRGTLSTADDEVTISGAAANIGTPVIAYGDATNNQIKYVVAINTNGAGLADPLTNWSDPVIIPGTGHVGPHFSLNLVDGFPAIAYQDADLLDLKFIRASNATGLTNNLRDPDTQVVLKKLVSALTFSADTSWGAPVTLDSSGDVGQYPSLAMVNGQPTTAKDRPAISYYDATNGDLKYVVAPASTGSSWGTPAALVTTNDVGMFTSLAMVNGLPAVSYYNNTLGDLNFLIFNDASGYSRISFDSDATWSGAVALNGSLMIAPASGLTTSITGTLTGPAGFRLVSDGILSLTNAANNFGTSLASPGVTNGPGSAINGAAIIRSGSLHLGSSTALGGATVELGDAVPQLISVDRATSFGSLLAQGGTFIALHDGRNRNVDGPGAFVKVGATVDGHYYGLVPTVADNVTDRLTGNLSAGTEIQLIGQQVPPGTAADTSYFVINPSGTDFQISLTPGGTRVNMTGIGSAVFFIEKANLNAQILVKDENQNPERNGVYRFFIDPDNTSLSANVMNLGRVAGFDSPAEMRYGVRVSVQNGTSAGKSYFMAGNVTDLNYSAVHWVEDRLNSPVALLASTTGLTIANPIDVNAFGGTGASILGATSNVTTGQVNFNGAVTLQNQQSGIREDDTLTLTSSITEGLGVVIGGVISEADGGAGATNDRLSLTKMGAGISTLFGNNTFSGGITVNEGGLLVMNTPVGMTDSATGTGSVTVYAGAVLGGNGTINGPVTLAGAAGNTAVLRPGDPTTSSSPVETLTINQPLTVSADSVVEFTLGAANYTKLVGTSIFLTTSSSHLLVQLEPGYKPAIDTEFDLLDFTTLTLNGGAANLLNLLQLPVVTVWDTTSFMTTGKIVAKGDAQPAAVTADPASQTVQQGTNVTFSIVGGYTGTAPISIQWTKDGQDILGATSETLVITGATQGSEGAYRVRVSNPVNPTGALSNPATLTVDWPLSFAVNLPATRRGSVGDPITFQVVMNGESSIANPITYQWRKGPDDIPGQTSSSYTIANVSLADQATYSVVVKGPFNPAGITSTPCVFTASSGPAVVLESPGSQTLLVGSTLNLMAAPGGDNNARMVQWRRNAVAIPGANTNTLTIPNITLALAGDYTFKVDNKVIATGKVSSAISDSARIVVVDNPNSIVPGQLTKTITLTVNVMGPTTVKPVFEWLKNGGALPADGRFIGSNTKTLTIKNLVHADTDVYTCRVTGFTGTAPVLGGTQFVRVYDAVPQIVETTAPPAGIVGGAYSWKIPVLSDADETDPDHLFKWKTTPATYAVTGLPLGLKVDAKTGVISGRPTTKTDIIKNPNGNPITVTVTNAVSKDTWNTFILVNPLPDGIAGTYAGPIARHAALNGNLGGRFDLTVTTGGVASGKITLGSATARSFAVINGNLEIDVNGVNPPQATLVLPATATLPALTIRFKLGITPGTLPAPSVTVLTDATISDGTNTATFKGWRNNWAATAVSGVSAKADAYAGDYTFGMMLPDGSPLIGDTQVPQGAGYGIFKVISAGTFTLAGRTADGETLTGSYWIGPNGEFFIFQLLYTTTIKGSILGELQIEAAALNENNDIFGDLTQVRPPNSAALTAARTYRSGFGTTLTASGVTPTTVTQPVPFDAVGGRYIAPPVTGTVFMGLTAATDPNRNAELIFSEDGVLPVRGAAFPAPYTQDVVASRNPNIPVTIAAKSLVIIPKINTVDNPASTTLTPVLTSGAFSGKFTLSDSIPRPPLAALVIPRAVTYQGAVIRVRTSAIGDPRVVQRFGIGYFLIDQLPPNATTLPTTTPRLSGSVILKDPAVNP